MVRSALCIAKQRRPIVSLTVAPHGVGQPSNGGTFECCGELPACRVKPVSTLAPDHREQILLGDIIRRLIRGYKINYVVPLFYYVMYVCMYLCINNLKAVLVQFGSTQEFQVFQFLPQLLDNPDDTADCQDETSLARRSESGPVLM